MRADPVVQLAERFVFQECSKALDSETVRGVSCQSDGDTLYHHTEMANLSPIREAGELRPSLDPFRNGTVNLTLNPNFHRFGSLRLLFNRRAVGGLDSLSPMCYTAGEDERQRITVRDNIMEKRRRASQPVGSNRADHELGAESAAYRHECKHFTKGPLPLKGALKGVEYWLPWQPAEHGVTPAVGANVSPCHASWSAWSTSRSSEENVRMVLAEIQRARAFAEEMRVDFALRSCYPYANLDRDEVAIFDDPNLSKMERGEPPQTRSRYAGPLPEDRCLCPAEELPEG